MYAVIKSANGCEIQGELNFTTITQIYHDSLVFLDNAKNTIDLAKVTMANSAGIALLIEWQKYAKSKHIKINFTNIPKKLQNIINLCNLTELF